jgi:hypothetical protein
LNAGESVLQSLVSNADDAYTRGTIPLRNPVVRRNVALAATAVHITAAALSTVQANENGQKISQMRTVQQLANSVSPRQSNPLRLCDNPPRHRGKCLIISGRFCAAPCALLFQPSGVELARLKCVASKLAREERGQSAPPRGQSMHAPVGSVRRALFLRIAHVFLLPFPFSPSELDRRADCLREEWKPLDETAEEVRAARAAWQAAQEEATELTLETELVDWNADLLLSKRLYVRSSLRCLRQSELDEALERDRIAAATRRRSAQRQSKDATGTSQSTNRQRTSEQMDAIQGQAQMQPQSDERNSGRKRKASPSPVAETPPTVTELSSSPPPAAAFKAAAEARAAKRAKTSKKGRSLALHSDDPQEQLTQLGESAADGGSTSAHCASLSNGGRTLHLGQLTARLAAPSSRHRRRRRSSPPSDDFLSDAEESSLTLDSGRQSVNDEAESIESISDGEQARKPMSTTDAHRQLSRMRAQTSVLSAAAAAVGSCRFATRASAFVPTLPLTTHRTTLEPTRPKGASKKRKREAAAEVAEPAALRATFAPSFTSLLDAFVANSPARR